MDKASKVLAGTMLFAALTAVAGAHHSNAMFDEHKSVTIKGTVTRFDWTNPHVYVYVEQTVGGNKELWEVECSPPSILKRLGWSQDSVHVGDNVEITGRPSRDPSKKSLLPNLFRDHDVVLFERKGELDKLAKVDTTNASTAGRHIDGVWVTALALKVEEQLDVDKLHLTPKGKKAAHDFNDKQHPGARCVPSPAPVFMLTPDLKRIATVGNTLVIDGEFDGAQRTIYLDAANAHAGERTVQGYSVGHWEGDTLVIESTMFADHALGNAYGLPSGAQKRLIEKLSLEPDGKHLTYHFELSDPEYLAVPFIGDVHWVYRPDLTYAALQCDPENASRFLK